PPGGGAGRAARARRTGPPPLPPGRPLTAPFAAVFGLLVAAEDLYLGWLLWEPDPGLHWYVVVSAALALLALAGAALVLRGRGRGWLVLALAAVLPMLLLLASALLFGAIGDGSGVGWSLLLLAGPLGCLVLAVRRPIREWTRPGRGNPAPAPARPGRTGSRGR
ncbi:hypothetical protein ACWKWC_21395, partial [Geodermatophilus nigrescens]